MGCSISKLDDKEAVQLCKDRTYFIAQAVEQRARFASGHLAYIKSMERVCSALHDFVEGFEPQEVLLDSLMNPSLTAIKKSSSGLVSTAPKSFVPIQAGSNSATKICYLLSGGSQAVSVAERPQSPETFRVESYFPTNMDGFFAMQMQSPPMNSSFVSYSPNIRDSIPPPSPQPSQWDGFWDPFSSLDYYGYLTRSTSDPMIMDDAASGLKKVREEEGLLVSEKESKQEEAVHRASGEQNKPGKDYEEVLVEDVNEEEDNDKESKGTCKHELSGAQNQDQVEVHSQDKAVADGEDKVDKTPGFTVYVDHRPTSMTEVVKDLKEQFAIVCNSAKELSAIFKSTGAQHLSNSNELTAINMLNPVTLFHSSSSRSSRPSINSSSVKEEYLDSSNLSEESCLFSSVHQSTLDRLYAWEKKLYKEVKNGERIRIAYEKKCMQLSGLNAKEQNTIAANKIKAAIRDLHIKIKMSMHSVEAISERIKILWDEELLPQLWELVQGLARMWKVMADCHQSQRQTLDEAKLLLPGKHPKLETKRRPSMTIADLQSLAKLAASVEIGIRNWRACFAAWIGSQRSYIQALSSWLLSCVRTDPDTSRLSLSPRWSSETHPVYGLCIQWARFLDSIEHVPVLDGLDTFATRMGSLFPQQLKDDHQKNPGISKRSAAGLSNEQGRNQVVAEAGEVEDEMLFEKITEVAAKVVCAGMSVAMSSLTEFAINSAEGYAELVKQWECTKWPRISGKTRTL